MNAKTAAIQGSGWGWLGWNKGTGRLEVVTTANQDPLLSESVFHRTRVINETLSGAGTWRMEGKEQGEVEGRKGSGPEGRRARRRQAEGGRGWG